MRSNSIISVLMLTSLLFAGSCQKEKLDIDKKSPAEISWRAVAPAQLLWEDGQALYLNNQNQVVGYQNDLDVPGSYYPVLYDNGVVERLWESGLAYGVNDHLQVVGTRGLGLDNVEAILWEKGNVQVLWTGGPALSINIRGQVVGSQGNNAVMWDKGNLTTLWENGRARRINDRGQVVGYRGTEAPYEAMLWEKGVASVVFNGFAQDIDLGGRIVGQENGNAVLFDKGQVRVLWTNGIAQGLNFKGQATGNQLSNGVLWQNGNRTIFGGNCAVYALNIHGKMVGAEFTSPYKAVLWSPEN